MLQRAAVRLVVEKGPLLGLETTVAPGQRLVIGRRPGVDLLLSGDDFVSLEHAEVVYGDAGLTLRNRSSNGTLLNGHPVTDAPLTIGDRISIGLGHLLAVRTPSARGTAHRGADAGTARPVSAPSGPVSAATRTPFRVPRWLTAYLIVIACAGTFLGYVKIRGSVAPDLKQVQAQEQMYAASRQLPVAETDRLLHLLETASVHERRGDTRSAYEAYREALSARRRLDPRSPAYRYAATRLSGLGRK